MDKNDTTFNKISSTARIFCTLSWIGFVILTVAQPAFSKPPQYDNMSQNQSDPIHVPVKPPQDITVSKIKFIGAPAEVTVSKIKFSGLHTDIAVSTIKYDGKILTVKDEVQPLQQATTPSPQWKQVVTTESPECGEPRVQILSPKDKQLINGDLYLQLLLTCTTGSPQVNLQWIWYPDSVHGQWPDTALQKSVNILLTMIGQYEITIPRSQFPKPGNYRVTARMKTGPNLENRDEKRFVISTKTPLAATIKPKSVSIQKQLSPISSKILPPPTIIKPGENHKLSKPGKVIILARSSSFDGKIRHQVEWKPFNSNSFKRSDSIAFSVQNSKDNSRIVGALQLKNDGYYRIRIKLDQKGSNWSSWRNIVVGSALQHKTRQNNLESSSKLKLKSKKNKSSYKFKSEKKKKKQNLKTTEESQSSIGSKLKPR